MHYDRECDMFNTILCLNNVGHLFCTFSELCQVSKLQPFSLTTLLFIIVSNVMARHSLMSSFPSVRVLVQYLHFIYLIGTILILFHHLKDVTHKIHLNHQSMYSIGVISIFEFLHFAYLASIFLSYLLFDNIVHTYRESERLERD